jgi:hypothetical protein
MPGRRSSNVMKRRKLPKHRRADEPIVMTDEGRTADELISGSLKKSQSYHSDYGHRTYGEIKRLAADKPPDQKAKQMKKLIEQVKRLKSKAQRPRR